MKKNNHIINMNNNNNNNNINCSVVCFKCLISNKYKIWKIFKYLFRYQTYTQTHTHMHTYT